MNVFLPYPDYSKSIECLDKKRCFKQLVEASQLIDGLLGIGSLSWTKHPASKMYVGHVNSLIKYHNICYEVCKTKWKIRLKKSKRRPYICDTLLDPSWLGLPEFHQKMRQNLTRKNSDWYSQFWNEDPAEGYYWPI